MSAANKNNMDYRRLGSSGLKVSRAILGCLSYGDKEWQDWVIDDENEVVEHVRTAYEMGVNTFDLADQYSNGRCEELVGKAIKKLELPRENLVLMTKVFFMIPPGDRKRFQGTQKEAEDRFLVNQLGLSRKHIFHAVDDSLRRLGVDYIDVLQCHRFDYNVPIAETMQALHDVVQSGKVRYIGMSSCWTYQFHTMQNYAETKGLTKFISMQNYHNALYREEEREMLPYCRQTGVGVIPWSPIARGILARPSGVETLRTQTDTSFKWFGLNNLSQGDVNVTNCVEEIAKKRGIPMAQVAVAWSLAQSGITAVIIGSTKVSNLQQTIGGVNITLTPEEIAQISDCYVARSVTGHE